MVRVEEVFSGAAGLAFIEPHAAASINDDNEYEDIDGIDDDATLLNSESFLDRIIALKGIVPYSFRRRATRIFASTRTFVAQSTAYLGNAAWIFTTSMILIGLPVLYAYDRERSMIEYEREQQKFDQQQQPQKQLQK